MPKYEDEQHEEDDLYDEDEIEEELEDDKIEESEAGMMEGFERDEDKSFEEGASRKKKK